MQYALAWSVAQRDGNSRRALPGSRQSDASWDPLTESFQSIGRNVTLLEMKVKAIRTILQEESPDLLNLFKHLHVTDDPLPNQDAVEIVWNDAIASRHCRYFWGFQFDQLISSCTITVIPNLTRGWRPYSIIENVVTHAEFRNLGWGKKVLKAALDFGWPHNCYKAMLRTGSRDIATLRFYEQMGFNSNEKLGLIARHRIE